MNEHDGAEKSPCATLSIDMKHSQNLQKADAPYGGSGEHLTIASHWQHHHGRDHHD